MMTSLDGNAGLSQPHSHATQDPSHHSHGAHHHGGHHHTPGDERGLRLTLLLTASVLVAEVIGGWWFNSLALLSDAAHMGADVFALVVALMALKLSQKPADAKQTYGYARSEALGAMLNASLLLLVAGFIVWEAIDRLITPPTVSTAGMLGIALLGLTVNLVGLAMLHGSRRSNLNLRAAYLEVLADTIGSVAVIIGALVMMVTHWTIIDPIIAILIALWITPRSLSLLNSSLRVLMEGVPEHIDLEAVRVAMAEHPAVTDVHDLHLWSIDSKVPALTAHLVIKSGGAAVDEVREQVAAMLHSKFHITHSTLQIEQRHCGVDAMHP